jgi:hypothetical protein
MLWHLRSFDFSGLDPEARVELEDHLRSFEDIPHLAAVRVGIDMERPDWTVLLCAFHVPEDLPLYRIHPNHVAFGEALRARSITTIAMDLETDDDPSLLLDSPTRTYERPGIVGS